MHFFTVALIVSRCEREFPSQINRAVYRSFREPAMEPRSPKLKVLVTPSAQTPCSAEHSTHPPTDVTDIPRSCGILSPEEIAITENYDAVDLAEL